MCFLIETILKPVISRFFGFLVISSQVKDPLMLTADTEWERDSEINAVYPDESDDNDLAANSTGLTDSDRDVGKWKLRKRQPQCLKKSCKCGNVLHIAKIRCDQCGRQKTPKTIDWNLMKKKAPKSAPLATKQVFNRICQLHAAHGRDVVVLIHNRDRQGRKFRVWGTPGAGQRFLEGDIGDAIRDAWRFQVGIDNRRIFEEGKKKRKANKKMAIETSTAMETSTTMESLTAGMTIGNRIDESTKENSKDDESSSSDEEQETDPNVYVVEEVLGMKLCEEDGVLKYHIKWKGFSHDVNTWEPEENIIDKSLLKPFRT